MNLRQAIETTKALNSNDKALLAHCSISSLDATQNENAELISGSVETVSWETIKNSVRR